MNPAHAAVARSIKNAVVIRKNIKIFNGSASGGPVQK